MFNKQGGLDFKQGWKTTEFWIAIAPMIVIVLGLLGVDVTPDQFSNWIYAMATVVGTAYALGRSLLKASRVRAVGQITSANAYVAQYNANLPQADA